MSKYVVRTDVPMKGLRIIPHHTVLNSSTKRLQQSLHEMMSVRFPKYPWQHKNGLRIELRENPHLWWVIRMVSAGDKKEIRFYVILPEDMAESFKLKVKGFEQWKRCTIVDLEPEDELKITDDMSLYRLTYEQDDMFSLEYNFNEQTSPIRDIMTVSNELMDGESVIIMNRVESLDRSKWKKRVDYSWEQWDKGGMIYRNQLDPKQLLRALVGMTGTLFNEVRSVLNDLMTAVERSFFKSNGTSTRYLDRKVFQNPDRAALLVNGSLSNRTNNKRNLAAFRADIRVVIGSPSPLRREVLSRSVGSSYSTLSGDNRLKMVKVNINARKELDDLRKYKVSGLSPNIISTEEAGKLCQLPTKELQVEFSDALESNQRIEVEIPKPFLDDTGIFMGTSQVRDQTFNIYWPTKDKDITFTPRAFIGSPRMGKDQACINYVVEANLNHGIGSVIPDVIDERNGHRGMADAIRDHLPPENVIDINLGDFDWPVYLGLDSLTKGDNDRIGSNLIAQYLTNFLMGDDIENHQTRENLREFAKATNGDLIGIKLFCLSKSYRTKLINSLREKGWDTLPLEYYHNQEGRQSSISGPILVRLGELLGDEFLKPIFGQQANPDVDLGKWMREGKVVIFRIPSRKLGEMAVRTIVYWITLLTFLTGISMDGKGFPGSYLILNEPHQFLSKGMIHFCKRMLMEGPKYRMAPIFLYHNPALLPREFNEVLMSSSLNWHIFKNSSQKVYDELAPYLIPTFTPEEAYKTSHRYHFISSWITSDGTAQAPFMTKAPDLVGSRFPSRDNSQLTVEHSKKYGKPIQEVLDHIWERQSEMYK